MMPIEKEISGADILIQSLIEQGVDTIFGYPGGAVLPIYDALYDENVAKKLRHILVRQEAGAAHAAEGYARSTGKTGVILVTSGPGVTNVVTGLQDALMDSIPIVCISGQVPVPLIGTDAFQEADTIGITRPCTKYNYLVRDVAKLENAIHEAFYIAKTGRPGPVLVDIPKNVQIQTCIYKGKKFVNLHRAYRNRVKAKTNNTQKALELIEKAQKPVVYSGGGVINSGERASELLTQIVENHNLPITSTLMGLGAFDANKKQWLGMLGMHGTYEANMAMYYADLILCVGARFDDRITGRVAGFSPGSKKIHIDIDPSSIDKNIKADVPIVGDCAKVLEEINDGLTKCKASKKINEKRNLWWQQIQKWQDKKCLDYSKKKNVIQPQFAIEKLYQKTKDKNCYITTEVGQHQMWAAQYYKFSRPRKWMTSGGLGTMGYGLPAAIGAQVAHPEATVIDIAGEASILMNIQEISTAVQFKLPVKIFIINNKYMGMVRQWQEMLHGSRYSHSYTHSLPDFVKLAQAYGAVGIRATKPLELDQAIDDMLEVNDKPVIFDCQVEKNENCFPMIPSGKDHNQMILKEHQKTEILIENEGKMLI